MCGHMTQDQICRLLAGSVREREGQELADAISRAEDHRSQAPDKVRKLIDKASQHASIIVQAGSWPDVLDACRQLGTVMDDVQKFYETRSNATNHERNVAKPIVRQARQALEQIVRTARFEVLRGAAA